MYDNVTWEALYQMGKTARASGVVPDVRRLTPDQQRVWDRGFLSAGVVK
jgi:hypothetical protein